MVSGDVTMKDGEMALNQYGKMAEPIKKHFKLTISVYPNNEVFVAVSPMGKVNWKKKKKKPLKEITIKNIEVDYL